MLSSRSCFYFSCHRSYSINLKTAIPSEYIETIDKVQVVELTPVEQWCLCFFITFLLGALAAVFSKTISAPFERIKIIQQCNYEAPSTGRPTPETVDADVKNPKIRALLDDLPRELDLPRRPLTSSFSESCFLEIESNADSDETESNQLSGGMVDVMKYIYINQGYFHSLFTEYRQVTE